MSNVVEFVLKLKDMMSGGMLGAAATARRAMATAETATRRVERASTSATAAIAATSRRAATELDNLNNRSRAAEGALGSLKRMAAGIALTAGVGMVANAGLQGQQQKASFEVMAGQQAGGKLYDDVTKFAQDSIFGNELYQNAQTMKAFGLETEKVMPNLRMLGDISMGNKEKLSSLTLAFSQIQSAGRLTGQDLLQLINAGFNPLQIISQKTGIGMADLKKKMEDGAISAKMVEDAFKMATGPGGQFHDMTNKIAATDFGKVEAAKGQIEGLALKIGGMLAPVIGDLVTNYLVPFLDWLSRTATWVQSNSEWLTPLVIGVTSFIGTVWLVTQATAAWTAAQAIFNMVAAMNPVVWIIAAIVALIAVIGYVIYRTDGWGKAWEYTVKGAQNLWKGFTDSIKALFLASSHVILSGIDNIKLGWYGLQSLWNEDAAAANIAQVNAEANARKEEIAKVTKSSMDNFFSAGQNFKAAGNSLSWNKGKSLSSAVKDLKGSVGIDMKDSPFSGQKGLGGANGKGAKSGSKGLSAAGVTHTGPKTITININKEMIGQLKLVTNNFKEGIGDLEDAMREMLLRVLYSAETAN